jgi:hypothetical protein
MKRRAHLPNNKLIKKTKNGRWRVKDTKNGTYKHSKKR